MNDLPDTIDQLGAQFNARLASLEHRVYALEHPDSASVAEPVQAVAESTPAPSLQALPITTAGGGFFSIFGPVLGKAMLGIAGAYLLRAVAEADIAPQALIAVLAIAYAIFWLVWAVRAPAGAWFAGATYACTSALILAPMLWELTLRFKILSADATAIALAAFLVAAFALTFKSGRILALWIASIAAAVLSVALSIATHDFLPFIAVLLFMALVSEAGAALERSGIARWGCIRILASAATDFALLILLYIYSGPAAARANYPALAAPWLIAPAVALLLICAAGILIHCGLRRKTVSTFAALQTSFAFLLAAGSLLSFAPPPAATVLGVACLAMSVACYTAVFTLFKTQDQDQDQISDQVSDQRRNQLVFSIWSAALALAGSVLCLPYAFLAACLGAAAVAATLAGTRLHKHLLAWHGAAYLFASATTAGLFAYFVHALAGAMPTAPTSNVYIAALCSILCYAVSNSTETEPWRQQVAHLATAAMASISATALLVQALVSLISLRIEPAAHHLAFIRTLILCATALALAFGGVRWHRRELTRIGYATLALVAVKLVAEDLPLGRLAYIAASIFLFAITLITVPRVARKR